MFFKDLKTHFYSYQGPHDHTKDGTNALPSGLSRVTCSDFIAIAFLNRDEPREIINMFSLEPGKQHVVRTPDNVDVVIECGPKVKWSVKYSHRFNRSNPNRVAVPIRPRTQQEEMQDYLNEAAARAFGKDIADKLRSGRAEFDISQDDYAEHYEDDEIAPLTTHQLSLIINEIQKDIQHIQKMEQKQKDIEDEAPPVPLKDGNSNAGTKGDPSGSGKTGEVKQKTNEPG